MDIRVSGHQVDTGDALRTHVDSRVRAADQKYSARLISVQVTFGKGPHDHRFTCEVIAHAPQGLVMKATDGAATAHAACARSGSSGGWSSSPYSASFFTAPPFFADL